MFHFKYLKFKRKIQLNFIENNDLIISITSINVFDIENNSKVNI